MKALVLLPAVAVLAACQPTPRMSLEEAIAICTKRAIAFGRMPFDPERDEPPNSVVQDNYRACVWAYSGQYPPGPVVWRTPPLRQNLRGH